MEKTEKASIHGGRNPRASIHGERNPASSCELNEELHINSYSLIHIQGQEQSQLSISESIFMRYEHRDPLPMNHPPMPHLEEPSSTSPNREAPKIKNQVDSVSKWKCSECGKEFDKEKAMFGHKRVHSVRRFKVPEENLVPKQETVLMANHEIYTVRRATKVRQGYKPESITDHESRTKQPLSKNSCATEKWGWDVNLDVNCSAEDLALFLIGLSQSDGKTHTCEECNRSFPSHKTFCEHFCSHSVKRKSEEVLKQSTELKRRNEEVVLKPSTELKRMNEEVSQKPSTEKFGGNKLNSSKKKPNSKTHKCEKCGAEYRTGQELGGHKRAHYNRPPKDQ